jgi:two-component system phosphate regulon sensor histidine kinase PhoR
MKTIFRQSLLILTLSALGLSLLFMISVLLFMDSLYYEINTQNIRNTARLVLRTFPEEKLYRYFERDKTETPFPLAAVPAPFRLTLIDRDGAVLVDSRFSPEELENHGDRPEVRAALAGREGGARRSSESLGVELLYTALPVYGPPGTGICGVFRLSMEAPNFFRRISSAALPFLFLGSLFFLAALGAVYLFSRSLSRSFAGLIRIAGLVHSADRFQRAIGSPRLISDTEEFIALERALKSMAAELNARIELARAGERRLEAILNGMSEAVFALDERLMLRLVNRRARLIFGIGDEGGPLSLLEAARSAELEEAAKAVLRENRSEEREIEWHTAALRRRFHVFASPLEQPEWSFPPGPGELPGGRGVVMVLGDITRLHKLEQVRKDFAANVSHELRTPIQVIKGFAETLLDSPLEDRGQIRHVIGIIEKNALAMENLTNDLLSLVSLEEEGGPRPDMEETDIEGLLEEAAGSAGFQAEKKKISLERRSSPGLSAKLNGALIVQALVNLLDNAVKYSPPASKVILGAEKQGDELVFFVRDQGMGIPAEHLDRIFERFYRVKRGKDRDSGGTGLGLAIVRHIALIHRGSVEVESHAGEGSLFRIRIPPG